MVASATGNSIFSKPIYHKNRFSSSMNGSLGVVFRDNARFSSKLRVRASVDLNVATICPPSPILKPLEFDVVSEAKLKEKGFLGLRKTKLVLLGDMGTGKTSLVLRFVKGQFFDYQESTIGAAFFSQILPLNEATVKFDIWDMTGQERCHSLVPMYYRGAAADVVVYDISCVRWWLKQLHKIIVLQLE